MAFDATTYALAKNYTNKTVQEKIGSVYTYKGSVKSFDDLPIFANIGDTYNILNEGGQNYAWTGSEWDSLGVNQKATDNGYGLIKLSDNTFTGYTLLNGSVAIKGVLATGENTQAVLMGRTVLRNVNFDGNCVINPASMINGRTFEQMSFGSLDIGYQTFPKKGAPVVYPDNKEAGKIYFNQEQTSYYRGEFDNTQFYKIFDIVSISEPFIDVTIADMVGSSNIGPVATKDNNIATASSTLMEDGYLAFEAFDHNVGSRWHNYHAQNLPVEWLALDIGKEINVKQIAIRWDGDFKPDDVIIQYERGLSGNWIDIGEFIPDEKEISLYTFPNPITLSKIRFMLFTPKPQQEVGIYEIAILDAKVEYYEFTQQFSGNPTKTIEELLQEGVVKTDLFNSVDSKAEVSYSFIDFYNRPVQIDKRSLPNFATSNDVATAISSSFDNIDVLKCNNLKFNEPIVIEDEGDSKDLLPPDSHAFSDWELTNLGGDTVLGANGTIKTFLPSVIKGNPNYTSQAVYKGLTLTQGKYYKIGVTISADVSRNFELIIQSDGTQGGDWSFLNTDRIFRVEAGQEYRFEAVVKAENIVNAPYLFGLMMGYVEGDIDTVPPTHVTISNFELSESDEPIIVSLTNIVEYINYCQNEIKELKERVKKLENSQQDISKLIEEEY